MFYDPFFKIGHIVYAISDYRLIVFHSMIILIMWNIKLQPQDSFFLSRRHDLNDSIRHSFKIAVIFCAFLYMDHIKLPYLTFILIEDMPCDTMFLSVESIDTLYFSHIWQLGYL